ncbi:hypothetical protein [Microbulbifer sp. SAOS-129_SWC]|uniref:hypothetical protein n=1 Tax=Microbulbifer sp. SAOS-129_SWC TaxID=3145235 RepID=UPI0032179392
MFSLIVAAALSGSTCGYDGPAQVIGRAYAPESKSLVYCELFLPTEGDKTTVLYYSAQGQRIAKKVLYGPAGHGSAGTPLPQVVQRDFRSGEQREVRRQGDAWLLRYRASGTANWEQELLAARKVDVIDAGFDAYVRAHWQQLEAGQSLTFQFASPPHGRTIKLRAHRVACASGTTPSRSEPATPPLCLRVDLAQALLRLFAGKLSLVYDTKTRRLLQFQGVVNLLDARGKTQRLHLFYEYR